MRKLKDITVVYEPAANSQTGKFVEFVMKKNLEKRKEIERYKNSSEFRELCRYVKEKGYVITDFLTT